MKFSNDKLQKALELAQSLLLFNKQEDVKLKRTTEETFTTVKVKSGDTMVEYNADLAVGSEVTIATGDGSTPAPDQTYELENGVSFSTKDGKIDKVITSNSPAKTPEELAAEEAAAAGADANTAPTAEDLQALSDRMGTIEQALQTILEALPKMPSAQQMSALERLPNLPTVEQFTGFLAEIKVVNEAIEAFSKLPGEKATDTVDEAVELDAAYGRVGSLTFGKTADTE